MAMNYCKDCGAKIEENEEYCSACEKERAKIASKPSEPAPIQSGKRDMSTGLLVVSILVTIFLNAICGIIAIICVSKATEARTDEEEEKHKKTAKLLCLLALALFVIGRILLRLIIKVL